MHLHYHMLSSIALGIALSACCGFRIFIPMLVASVAAWFHWVEIAPDMQWLGHFSTVLCFATAAIIEIAAYYFPFLDNILDAVAAPVAVVAGAVLAFAFLPGFDNEPLLRWVAAVVAGGATAGSLHVGTGLLRLFSTKATLGTGNTLVATGENGAALGFSLLSFAAPVLIAAVLLLVIGWILYKGVMRIKSGRYRTL